MRILAGEWGDNMTEKELKQEKQNQKNGEIAEEAACEAHETVSDTSPAEETPVGNAGTPDHDTAAELAKYKAQVEEYLQLLQRVQADFDNFRKRTAQEREDWSKYCSMRLVTNLLPVLYNLSAR